MRLDRRMEVSRGDADAVMNGRRVKARVRKRHLTGSFIFRITKRQLRYRVTVNCTHKIAEQ